MARKNVLPNTPEAKENGATEYSNTCTIRNIRPKRRVIIRPMLATVLPEVNEWWDHVRAAAEARRSAVFKRGTPKGSIGASPGGGQIAPSSIGGASEK